MSVGSVGRRARGLLYATPLLFAGWTGVAYAQATPGQAPDDSFITGYAAAILAREFQLPNAAVVVDSGVVRVTAPLLDAREVPRLQQAIGTIPGVSHVLVVEAETPLIEEEGEGAEAPAVVAGEAAPTPEPVTPVPLASGAAATVDVQEPQILARSTLFDPLLADRRWPHFSASYQYYTNDPDVEHAGATSFGETFSLYRSEGLGGQWEIGFQAGVFAVFDLASDSADLINADYWVGIPFNYRRGNFSSTSRIYHQSSHLGDEYLLREEVDGDNRVNVSYEAIDTILSYDINESWRVYGGAGYLFHREPAELEPWMTQAGVEWRGSELISDTLRPIAAADLQWREENEWNTDVALRAGFQIENSRLTSQTVQITAEYYNGRNPNGQFYERDLEYFGLGLHVYFD